MYSALMITLREGIEAFLIVAITLAYLKKTGRGGLAGAVYAGVATALVASWLASLGFAQAENKPLWEGVLALATSRPSPMGPKASMVTGCPTAGWPCRSPGCSSPRSEGAAPSSAPLLDFWLLGGGSHEAIHRRHRGRAALRAVPRAGPGLAQQA